VTAFDLHPIHQEIDPRDPNIVRVDLRGERVISGLSSEHRRQSVYVPEKIIENFVYGPQNHQAIVRDDLLNIASRNRHNEALRWLGNQTIPGIWSIKVRHINSAPSHHELETIFSFSDKKFATIFKAFWS
jgi:hypothetical protein